jgi:hypothetical protein
MKKVYVSFIVPTRKRTHQLLKSCISIEKNTTEKNIYEILICADEDDIQTIQWVYKNKKRFNLKLIKTKRYGYDKAEKYFNLAAAQSSGDWLWLWNDDVRMTSQDWYKILRKYDKKFLLINPHTVNYNKSTKFTPLYSTFPILPRKWFKLLGHLSLWQHSDTYLTRLAHKLFIFQNEHRIKNIHERIHDSITEQNIYLKHPLPVNHFSKDLQVLKNYFGKKKILINFIKSLPWLILFTNKETIRRIRAIIQRIIRYAG